jgi:hypothetical protein
VGAEVFGVVGEAEAGLFDVVIDFEGNFETREEIV